VSAGHVDDRSRSRLPDASAQRRQRAASRRGDPSSKLKRDLARILKEQGYIEAYQIDPPVPGRPSEQITVTLKYTDDRKPVISGIQRVSRPGQRTYVDHAHIPRIQAAWHVHHLHFQKAS